MPNNRINATFSAADQKEVLVDLDNLLKKLPFLVDLSPEERKRLFKMGDGSQAFLTRALEVARQNPDILPRRFDLDEFAADLDLYFALAPLALRLRHTLELVEDTLTIAGAEGFAGALVVYNATEKAEGLEDARDDLAQRFKRKKNGAAPSANTSNS